MGSKKNVKDIASAGGHKIGFLTWYDIENANITPAGLNDLFTKHGLDVRHLPDDIKPKNAFQKAVRMSMVETSKSSDDRKSIAKLIVDGLDKIIYGIVDLNVNAKQENINPDFADTVTLDKQKLVVISANNHPLAQLVVTNYNKLCGEYTSRDIARMIVHTMDRLCCVPLRDAGVVYFVPVGLENELLALQNVVNDLGGSNMKVYALDARDGNAQDVERAARSQIQDRISALKGEIETLAESMSQGTVKGESANNSIEVRRRRFNELKLRCQILADALRIKAEDLEGDLGKVNTMIENELESFVAGAA